MKKAGVLSILALLALAAIAEAQQPGKIPRIGFLDNSSASGNAPLLEAFRQEMRKLGWIEGKNISIEYRFAEQKLERLPELAADLVRLKVDLIVASGGPTPLAAKGATTTIPIVMVSATDPVGAGLIASLARPGGNVTGTSGLTPELITKPVQPDAALSAVVGNKAMPRTEVTKKLWAYIKKNRLQDEKKKTNINADDKLKAVFGGKKTVTMFEMTKLVSKHVG
jgi:ABC-type uncharacterized transport system substrate-binding protein